MDNAEEPVSEPCVDPDALKTRMQSLRAEIQEFQPEQLGRRPRRKREKKKNEERVIEDKET